VQDNLRSHQFLRTVVVMLIFRVTVINLINFVVANFSLTTYAQQVWLALLKGVLKSIQ